MELEGQITEIIYKNDVNAYTICVIETSQGEITTVGYLPFVEIGDSLKVHGKFVVHKEYGEQFKVDTFEKIVPETEDGLIQYLTGIIKGVGKVTAKKIVREFGEDTINVIKNDPKKLALVNGITIEKAETICEEFNNKWEMWQLVKFLERFGIGIQNAQRIYKELGDNAISEIERNPYVLVDIVYGLDFKKIDKLAMEIGVDVTYGKRIESGIKYGLISSSTNGNTCVLKANLIEFTKQLLGVDEEYINNSLINCKMNQEIVIETQNEEEWVYLKAFYQAEENIANKIMTLLKTENIKKIHNFEKVLEEVQKSSEITLSEKQEEAIRAIKNNNVCIITGGPGTGKTTIIKTIIEIFEKEGMKPVLCAPTGRAAKRMTETTGKEAKTIHRLLEIGKFEENRMNSVDDYVLPIDGDIIIIDEMSMVDIFLMNYLMKGIYQGSKLVLVGDSNQLSSVGPGNVLKDLIESEVIPTVQLNTIFRQAARSKIVINAHNVNSGEKFVRKQEDTKDDFFYINEKEQDKIINNVITLCGERLKNYGEYDFYNQIQVITPTKKGPLGTKELNKQLQKYLNGESPQKKEKNYGEQIFREGDRIMQTRNNYDIVWEKNSDKKEVGTGIFNGELGRIRKIDEKEKQIKIVFDDDKEAWYNYSDLEQLELAYAITIHKAQRQ